MKLIGASPAGCRLVLWLSVLLLVALTIASEGFYANLETAIPCLLILVSTLGLLRHRRNETQ